MTAAEPVRAGHRAWLGLAVLALPCLQQVAQDGAGWSPLLIVAGGLAVGGAFLQRQRILPDPLIDLRMFRAPVFRSSSERLPTQLRGGLVDAARDAFTQGLRLTAVIGAVIAVGTALPAATVREHLPPAGQSGRLADAGPIPAQHRSWARSPS
jgi:hypothetical protein